MQNGNMSQRLSKEVDNLFFHVFLRVGWWVIASDTCSGKERIIMEDIITQVLQKQFLGYDVLELENRSLQKLEEMVLYD